MMKKFQVSVRIGLNSVPYESYMVLAYDKRAAVERVHSILPKWKGHRFLNAVAVDAVPGVAV